MQFIRTYIFSVFFFLTLFLGLIISVDPYEKLGINLFGFETKAVAQGRENKFNQFEYSKKNYAAFILGSSAAHRYPTQTLKELTGYESYNYAVQHTTPEDYLAILKHIISKKQAKLVVLQLDFTDLDETYPVDNRLYNSSLKKYIGTQRSKDVLFDNAYFTLDAVRDSFRVIYVNLFGKAGHIYAEDGNYIYEAPRPGPVKLQQDDNAKYKLSKERIQKLRQFMALADQSGIRVVALTAPLSHQHLINIQNNPVTKELHQKYVQSIQSVFNEAYNFQHASIKNYSHYKNFHNSTHPTKEFSAIILERMFGNKYLDLGLKL